MNILGISAFYHDSAAALIRDGRIVGAAQEERFTRIKHHACFPQHAVSYVLKEGEVGVDELDAVVFYDKPLLKFERLLETYYTHAPRGVVSFARSMPVWIREKIMLKRIIYQELGKIMPFDKKKLKMLFPEHHLSHAASAFFPSPYREAAILTLDGVGEWTTASISHGSGGEISILKELKYPHSPGLLYSAFTYFLGFRVNSGEYKLMGLAPYGNAESERVAEYERIIKRYLIRLHADGSLWMNQDYFSYSTGLKMIREKKWERLFGMERRKPETAILPHHCDLAMAIQRVTEEIVLKMASEARRLTNSERICMAGGVALNCVANGKLLKSGVFKQIFIQPAAGDAGGALGAALAAYHIYFRRGRSVHGREDGMQGAYLGPAFSEEEIKESLDKVKAVYRRLNERELIDFTTDALRNGSVVGWFQGRMEFGPRALGNRSILADPRNETMQKKLNLKIKNRESFRPFAPSVLSSDVSACFDLNCDSPYMLFVAPVSRKCRLQVPDNYRELDMHEKLYCKRSLIQAVTHVDFSARVQTVHHETNPLFHQLIAAFKEKTDCPLLVNTSFNVRGEPIVCTPQDAFRCFLHTEMDCLVIGAFVLKKEEQQPEKKTSNALPQSD